MTNILDIIGRKTVKLHFSLLLVITLLSCMGFVLLFDAAGGSMSPYADRQIVRFVVGMCILYVMAITNIKFFYHYAYVFYFLALLLLIGVQALGYVGMGAQRWINLGGVNIQPSELAKVTLILALARFYQSRPLIAIHSVGNLLMPMLMILLYFGLVVIQPDLGTSLVIVFLGAALMFAAGVSRKIFMAGGLAGLIAIPLGWFFVLKEYQKNRLLVFMNPESDPLGAGYHIMQSKIAIGSAGFWGKGFGEGTQSHLQFLPEKHTDFIFTMLIEDFGMAGGLALLGGYALLIWIGVVISLRSNSTFARLTAMGSVVMVFLHAIINMAMVMGLMPVVGIPLPFISYGGTSMMTMLFAMGLLMNAYVHRDVLMNR